MRHSLGVLVELLAGRSALDDVAQARDVVARFETPPAAGPEPAVQLWPLQYQPRLADAADDAAGYTDTVIGDPKLAEELDARGHLAVAQRLAAQPAFRSRA